MKTTVGAYLYTMADERTKKATQYIGIDMRVAASNTSEAVTTWGMTAGLSLEEAVTLMETLRKCLIQSDYYTGGK